MPNRTPNAADVARDLAQLEARYQRRMIAAQLPTHVRVSAADRPAGPLDHMALDLVRIQLQARGWRVWAVEGVGGDAWLAVLGRKQGSTPF